MIILYTRKYKRERKRKIKRERERECVRESEWEKEREILCYYIYYILNTYTYIFNIYREKKEKNSILNQGESVNVRVKEKGIRYIERRKETLEKNGSWCIEMERVGRKVDKILKDGRNEEVKKIDKILKEGRNEEVKKIDKIMKEGRNKR